ncbi:MAG: biotin transporter BioY [Bosea sp. (in: a-proteobacteria)]
MASALSLNTNTLASAFLPTVDDRRLALLRDVALAVAGSLLLVISAKVQVPFWPVPMTMQSLAVLFLGAALGPRLGAITVALYLAQGAMGYPVFANTPPQVPSLAYFMGPTGGFLLSFIPAAYVAGVFSKRGASLGRVLTGMTLAHALIFALGFVWLAFFAQLASGATGIGMSKAFLGGVWPFMLGTVVKVALATALVAAGWQVAKRRG